MDNHQEPKALPFAEESSTQQDQCHDAVLALSMGRKEDSTLANDAVVPSSGWVNGWRLYMITTGLCFCVFLCTLEISIVSTSLLSITNDLNGFSQGSWVITVYLVNYTGFMIIFAKLSDIFGRKLVMTVAISLFCISSGACGAAQTLVQLIVFRAFQGLAGSGMYSISFVILPEMVPNSKYAFYASIVSSTFVFSFILGPLLGGVINNHSTWRWVFLLNVPASILALVILILAIPASFPHGRSSVHRSMKNVFSKEAARRLDFLGFLFLLSASVLTITGFQEAATRLTWRNSSTIALLTVSGLLWIGFFLWSRFLSREGHTQEPVFTWRFAQNREFIGVLLIAFLVGFPFTIAIVSIPQRLQASNGDSPLEAAFRLLPLAGATPIASGIASILTSKLKVPPLYVLFMGSALQMVGVGLFSSLSILEHEIPPAQYGYEAIMGFGFGLNVGTLVLMAPFVVDKRDLAIAMGAVNQFRLLGGAIGLGILTSVLNNQISSSLRPILSPGQLSEVFKSTQAIEGLPPALRAIVRTIYADAYDLQMRVLIGVCGTQILVLAMIWKKKPTILV